MTNSTNSDPLMILTKYFCPLIDNHANDHVHESMFIEPKKTLSLLQIHLRCIKYDEIRAVYPHPKSHFSQSRTLFRMKSFV